ncbi:hypothetical protein ACHAWF_003908 [Thalassiosira exigua]
MAAALADDPPTTHGCSPALLLGTPSLTRSVAAAVASGGGGEGAASAAGSGESFPVGRVDVHPLVLLSVLDHHTRRQEGAGRVIGTLLGKRDGDRVEITNAFAVPHAERGDEVAIGKDFNRQMLALHLRANPRETVVGWYATSLPDESGSAHRCIADTSSLIHEFYAGECDDDPVHLVVDASLQTDDLSLRAYRSAPVCVRGEPLANAFHEVRLALRSSDAEKICADRMANDEPTSRDEGAALKESMRKLHGMLETCSGFVDQVVDGTVSADDELGRDISEALGAVPRIRPELFDKMFNDSLQDLLMVTYLSNITKTQLTIAEKLNETLGK